MEHVQCLIIGSGPAGYTAAIYAARAGLKPILYTGMMAGGQLTLTSDIDNFPGYPDGINGSQMMEDLKRQAERFGTQVRFGQISSVDFSARPHRIYVDGEHEIIADAVIVSTGASAKWLGLESEKRYNGGGVSACAICDGFFFKGQDVAISGGGDTAAEEAVYLAKLCRKVYMIIRKGEFRASKAMVDRVLAMPNIEVLYNSETLEITGDGQVVTGATIINTHTGAQSLLDISGFFVAIGHRPNTDIFKDWLAMNPAGYILTKPGSTHTSMEGVFCCGDAQDHVYRQAVTAAGTGCMAALDAERYLAQVEGSFANQDELPALAL